MSAEPPKFTPTNGVKVQSADAGRGAAASATVQIDAVRSHLRIKDHTPLEIIRAQVTASGMPRPSSRSVTSTRHRVQQFPGARDVALRRVDVPNRKPQHESSVEFRVRKEDLARRVDGVEQPRVILVRAVAQA